MHWPYKSYVNSTFFLCIKLYSFGAAQIYTFIVFLDGWSVVDLEAVVRCTDGQRPDSWLENTQRLGRSGWECTVKCTVYSVHTAEPRRRLSGTSHSGQSRRRGAVTREIVKMFGDISDIWWKLYWLNTSENNRRNSAEETGFILKFSFFLIF